MKTNKSNPQQSALQYWRNQLSDSFSESDISILCFDLNVEYDDLPGIAKNNKIASLLNYMRRHQRLAELTEYCSIVRPTVDWSDILNRYASESTKNQLTISKQVVHSEKFRNLYIALRKIKPAIRSVHRYFYMVGHLDRLSIFLSKLKEDTEIGDKQQLEDVQEFISVRDKQQLEDEKEYIAHNIIIVTAGILNSFQYLRELDTGLIEFGFDTMQARAIEKQIILIEQALSDLGLYREYQKQLIVFWEKSHKQESPIVPFQVSWGNLEPFSPWAYRMIDEFLYGKEIPLKERNDIPDDINRYCSWHDMTILHMSDAAIRLTLSLFEIEPEINSVYTWISEKCRELAESIANNIAN